MSHPRLKFCFASGSDQGTRADQEDTVLIRRLDGAGKKAEGSILAVLSDGMGGPVSGKIASQTASSRYLETFVSGGDGKIGVNQLLSQSLIASNEAIGAKIRDDGTLGGMGCTLVAAYIDKDGLRWASVGNSSLMLYRTGNNGPTLHRLNEDHSLGALLDEQAAAHQITVEQARSDPRRHILQSALTGAPIAVQEIVTEPMPLLPGDWLMIASDGLDTLHPDEIMAIMREFNAEQQPRHLVECLLGEVRARCLLHQENASLIAIQVLEATDAAYHVIDPAQEVPVTTPVPPTRVAPPAQAVHSLVAVQQLVKSDAPQGTFRPVEIWMLRAVLALVALTSAAIWSQWPPPLDADQGLPAVLPKAPVATKQPAETGTTRAPATGTQVLPRPTGQPEKKS
jgi:PPM family protein phosphatase